MPKAVPPEESDGARDYDAQTTSADLADFDAALKAGAIKPPDAEKARAAHEAARNRIDGSEEKGELPAEFPSEFADYHRGALALGEDDAKAKAAWTELLARPFAERRYRTTWAAYMLGKQAIDEEDFDTARTRFREVRKAVADGAHDTLGLAAASLGWEAYAELHTEHFAEAARLYFQQLAAGDESAVQSLRTVLEEVLGKEDADLAKIARDPVLQRLGTAGAISGMSPFSVYFSSDEASPEARERDLGLRWLKALETIDAKNVRDAERLGWVAYSRGQFDRAARWLKRADPAAPYSMWLKAKLALRSGDAKTATALLSKAIEQLPPETFKTVASYARGDLGLVRVGRGEFLAALRLFADGGHVEDVQYLAEAVLTIEELTKLVEGEFVLTEELKKVAEDFSAASLPARQRFEVASALRNILAVRLTRAERFAEARKFFPEHLVEKVDEYAKLIAAAKNAPSKSEQAAAWWEAAQWVSDNGGELLNYSYPAAMAARLTGREVQLDSFPVIAMTFGKPDQFVPAVSAEERARLKQNLKPDLKRYYALYVAADLGWRAALLMPDNTDETAEVLNTAGRWLANRDEKAADRFYQAIERRCAKTELGKAAIKIHWFPAPEEAAEKPQ